MTIKVKKTGKILNVGDSYGRRMVEQGQASLAQAKAAVRKNTLSPTPKPEEAK